MFHDLTRLRQLEGVRQEFVANVSHELRTPLSLIKSAAETLLDGAKDDPAALVRFLEIIDKHANRLALLIDDLLLLSTLDSGGLRLDRQPLPFRSTVQDAIDDLQPRAHARDVTLENQVAGSLVVLADNDRMRQVISNLVDNAIKYGRAGGTTSVDGRVLADGRVEIMVADDGPGIPKEAQDRIFERFYRVDKARSREQGGTGPRPRDRQARRPGPRGRGPRSRASPALARGSSLPSRRGPGTASGAGAAGRPQKLGQAPGAPNEGGHGQGEEPGPDDALDDPPFDGA